MASIMHGNLESLVKQEKEIYLVNNLEWRQN